MNGCERVVVKVQCVFYNVVIRFLLELYEYLFVIFREIIIEEYVMVFFENKMFLLVENIGQVGCKRGINIGWIIIGMDYKFDIVVGIYGFYFYL